MQQGKMNWAGLFAYDIQPADMELFQSYMLGHSKDVLLGSRTKGLIFGGKLTVQNGLSLSVSAGLAVMPDGQLVNFPTQSFTLDAADPSNARIDRIELMSTLTNNTSVLDINSQSKTLDFLYVATPSVVKGTPATIPTTPVATSNKISLGFVTITAGQAALVAGNISQVVDAGFDTSSITLGDKSAFIRYNQNMAQLQFSNDGIRFQAFGGGGGGGGGGGANWQPVDGLAPTVDNEYSEKVLIFAQGAGQATSLWLKVPSGYLPGSPITMKLAHYSPGTSGSFLFHTTATLVRKNLDPVSSTVNQFVSTNTEANQTVANQYRELIYDLSSPTGAIGGASVAPGDLINVTLSRVSPSGTEDSSDVRMIPSSTEVLYS
jgi:hypothetical protein